MKIVSRLWPLTAVRAKKAQGEGMRFLTRKWDLSGARGSAGEAGSWARR